jgi:hypothetical protein
MFIYYSGDLDINNYLFITDLFSTHKYLLVIYYIFFTVTIVVLVLMNWRENEFMIEKIQLLETLYAIITFYSVWAKILFLLPIFFYYVLNVLSFT